MKTVNETVRILVVEDNRDLAFGLRTNLEVEGYQVMLAEDGITGLLALAFLVIYYVILYFYREKLKKKFKVRIG